MDSAENQPVALQAGVRRAATIWTLALVGFAALLLVILSTTGEKVPSHAGRSAEAWLLAVFNPEEWTFTNDDVSQRPIIDAFRHMGTNGISFLVNTLERKDTAWNRMAQKLHPKLPAAIRQRLPEPVKADTLVSAAALLLSNMTETQPNEILPLLVELLDSPRPRTRQIAWVIVRDYSIRHGVLKNEVHELQLRAALGDRNPWIRLYAVVIMIEANLAGPEMIPALSPALTSGDPTLSNSVQSVIQRLEKLPPREP
jgi:hypothetical protein